MAAPYTKIVELAREGPETMAPSPSTFLHDSEARREVKALLRTETVASD